MTTTARRSVEVTETPEGRLRVLARPADVTPSLITSLHRTGTAFGVVLYHGKTTLLSPVSSQRSFLANPRTAYYAANDVRNAIRPTFLSTHPRVVKLTQEDAVQSILDADRTIDFLGVVTQGRLTHCSFGDGYLHPDPPSSLKNTSRVVGPDRVRARHWFIQSCHSPYLWSHLPSMSVPMSLMTRSACALSVISSSRAQTGIPMILELYFELVLGGAALGDIALALNQYSNECNFDTDPFFLLGDPDNRPCRGRPDVKHSVSTRVALVNGARQEAGFVRRVLDNIRFLVFSHNFKFAQAKVFLDRYFDSTCVAQKDRMHKLLTTARNKVNNARSRLCKDLETWEASYHKGVTAGCNATSTKGFQLQQVWKAWTGERGSLQQATMNVNRLFQSHGGYYYWLGPQLEKNYAITSVERLDDKNGDDGFRQQRYRQLRSYMGGSPAGCNGARVCVIDDRDLFVRDVVSRLDASFAVESERHAKGIRVKFTFVNRQAISSWVSGFVLCTDPNNLSRNASERQYFDVLKHVRMAQSSARGGKVIEPGSSFCMSVDVDVDVGLHSVPLFYLLIEGCIFVDFAWNWLAVTYRSNCTETAMKWLGTSTYSESFLQEGEGP